MGIVLAATAVTLATFSLCGSTRATPIRDDVDPLCKAPKAPSWGVFSYASFTLDRRTQVVEFQAAWEKAQGANGYELCWEVLDGRRGRGDTIGKSACVIHTSTKFTSGEHEVYRYPNPLGRPINVRVRSLHLRNSCTPSEFVYLKQSDKPVGNKFYCGAQGKAPFGNVKAAQEQAVSVALAQPRIVGKERYIDATVSWVTQGAASNSNTPKQVCVAQMGMWGINNWVCRVITGPDQTNIFIQDIRLDDATTHVHALVRVTNRCSEYATTLNYGEAARIPQRPIPFPFKFFHPLELLNTKCLVSVPNDPTLRYGACKSDNTVRMVGYLWGEDEFFKTADGKCVMAVKGKDGKYRAQLTRTCVPGDLSIQWVVLKTNSYSLKEKFVRSAGATVVVPPGQYSPPLCLDFNSKTGSPAVLVECGYRDEIVRITEAI